MSRPKNDRGNDGKVVDINELHDAANLKATTEFNSKLMEQNSVLAEKLLDAEHKIKHLESLLTKHVPVIGNMSKLIVSDEEAVVELQLRILRNHAIERELTLDEVKKFEILSKRNSEFLEKAKAVEPPREVEELGEEVLLEMASAKISSDVTYVKKTDDE